jgi:hypothetical protein
MSGTNKKSKLYVCATAQPTALDATGFAALTWVEVGGIGSVGELGANTNIVSYDTWADDVIQKGKGNTNAGDPEVEVLRNAADAGQDILRTFGAPSNSGVMAFKVERNDLPSGGTTPTRIYNRAVVGGPTRPMGRSEDFDLEVFKLGCTQAEVVVEAA